MMVITNFLWLIIIVCQSPTIPDYFTNLRTYNFFIRKSERVGGGAIFVGKAFIKDEV